MGLPHTCGLPRTDTGRPRGQTSKSPISSPQTTHNPCPELRPPPRTCLSSTDPENSDCLVVPSVWEILKCRCSRRMEPPVRVFAAPPVLVRVIVDSCRRPIQIGRRNSPYPKHLVRDGSLGLFSWDKTRNVKSLRGRGTTRGLVVSGWRPTDRRRLPPPALPRRLSGQKSG